ncbi:Ribosome biogenesis protein MAK21 [Taphrina deformans PYCC 5710]|uniref:Ribosome biogenesis protein MAK21 n=1 Tax=Taphrina deformans (strain PYCC 5710 / ATCC 11124 / CBS 356.35 / IMI 108563 / JCM 9778 / NBRC 8474) TaxID=1097556 RepID=R4XE24_TAPDE|nr:Ribosome biogenesis protein MAK21 [Taphrina deformans PYCC 5710]|eukprot:CCG81583.1 Ribosome biogenesis protein MAK21 [Taphrina deformans PYCC 5710]
MSEVKHAEKKRHKEGKTKNEKLNKKKQILQEIEELGGDAEDYELIANIDSDQDDAAPPVEASKKSKNSKQTKSDDVLAKDLKRLAKELGLGAGKFLEQATIDDDYVSDDASDVNPAAQRREEVASTSAKETKEKKKKDKKESVKPEEDFKIHAKRAEPQYSGGHAKGEPMLEPTPLWHEVPLSTLEGIPEDAPAEFVINRQFQKAKDLLATENELYSTSAHVKSSDRQFLSTIMRSGTLNDRVSALTLVVQESPIHATKSMDALISMCKKKGRNEAVSSVGAVKDLMQGSILPNRKLKYFKDQEGVAARDITDRHLIMWAFEDYLKRFYFELLGVMEALSMDPLPFPRNHMVRYFFDLIKDKPEQEANLLRLLTNKLGDKDKKIASKCSHFCLQLMQAHPLMKNIIIRELEQVLFKPTISSSAQYYVIITLNQTILSAKDSEVANHLIEVYFVFFTKIINEGESTKVVKVEDKSDVRKNRKALKKEKMAEQTETAEEELNSKMISAVLTGVNRAFPFSKLDDNAFTKNLDTLYTITHSSNFNTSIQALILIHQVAVAKEETADRFYRTLYESINDPRLITSSKQALYLNLLFKALKSDRKPERTKAFVKRLVQSATMHGPAYICALFFLFSELEMAVPAIRQLTEETKKDIGKEQLLTPPSESEQEEKELSDAVKVQEEEITPKTYDGRARDPRFSNAEDTSLWEAIPFLTHFHPSVCLFAQSWLLREQMPSKPDLSLHTLSHFLDRFVYRNAKTKSNNKGGSIMQPLAGGDTRGMILQQSGSNQQPVNTESFYKQSVKNIAPDEMFFYNYFNDKMSKQPKKTKAAKKSGGDGEEDEGGMNEDDVWQALVQSRPDVEAPSDESDMEDEDLEELAGGMSDSEIESLSDDDDDDDDDGDDDAVVHEVDIPEFNESDFEKEENEFDEDDDDLLPSDDDDDDDDEDEDDKETEDKSDFTDFDKLARSGTKRKANGVDAEEEGEEKKDKKKKKIKLPAFASADEYMHLIDG